MFGITETEKIDRQTRQNQKEGNEGRKKDRKRQIFCETDNQTYTDKWQTDRDKLEDGNKERNGKKRRKMHQKTDRRNDKIDIRRKRLD